MPPRRHGAVVSGRRRRRRAPPRRPLVADAFRRWLCGGSPPGLRSQSPAKPAPARVGPPRRRPGLGFAGRLRPDIRRRTFSIASRPFQLLLDLFNCFFQLHLFMVLRRPAAAGYPMARRDGGGDVWGRVSEGLRWAGGGGGAVKLGGWGLGAGILRCAGQYCKRRRGVPRRRPAAQL